MGMHVVEHRHLDYDKAASAIFTEPEIADVGLAEADAFAERGLRLACQCSVHGDLEVTKYEGLWGQHVEAPEEPSP